MSGMVLLLLADIRLDGFGVLISFFLDDHADELLPVHGNLKVEDR